MAKGNLIIETIGIKDFRSFDSKGIFLNNLNKINLIVGKNNSGKSNVLKFLKLLCDTKGGIHKFPNGINNQHHKNNIGASIKQTFTFQELEIPYTFEYSDNSYTNRQAFTHNFFLDDVDFSFKFESDEFEMTFRQRPDSNWNVFDYYKEFIANAIISKHHITGGYRTAWDHAKNYYREKYKRLLTELCDQIIYIPDKRIIQENHNVEKSNSVINGTNLISKLAEMKNYELGEEDEYRKLKEIERQIAIILNVDNVEIQIPQKGKELVLIIDGKRLLIENFGTGVHDLVMFCCMLMLNKKSLVCIEEPETHMHPELQRRFIKFLSETDHQYIIATHSNVFIDFDKCHTSIYHIKYDGIKSYLSKSITNVSTREVVDDLGYKASDLLQTNGIIWVEGPSDRIYLNKWISLIKPELREGIHYTIMFYGGKLLSHLSFDFDGEREFIEMMKINPNSILLMDKDKVKINETKQRIYEELGEINCWITKGKEIENYISLRVLNKWLLSKKMNGVAEEIGLNTKFEKAVKTTNPEFKYELKKSLYAKEIIESFEAKDLEFQNLNLKIQSITDRIELWNKK